MLQAIQRRDLAPKLILFIQETRVSPCHTNEMNWKNFWNLTMISTMVPYGKQ